jgi:hypothetical protein
LKRIWPLLLLAGVVWAARFWRSPSFGFYEDDYNMVTRGMAMSADELWQAILDALRRFEGGKPLHASFIQTLAFLGQRLGGLQGVYTLAFLSLTLNVSLFYALLKRVHSGGLALLGGIAYALFSADTTQAFLTGGLGFQPSMTFLLLAFHSYLSDRRALSYLLSLGVLLTYEVPFPLFLAAPLLKLKWDRRLFPELLRHGALFALILALPVLYRLAIGEPRVAGLGFPELLTVPAKQMVLGPYTTLRSYLQRPYQTIKAVDASITFSIVLAFGGLLIGIIAGQRQMGGDRAESTPEPPGQRLAHPLSQLRRIATGPLVRLMIVGLVLLILAYPLTFTVSANTVSGRNTRVHFAAVVGASLLVASASLMLLQLARHLNYAYIGSGILALYFAILVGYGTVLQRDYADAWRYQTEFWSQLLPQIGDVEAGTAVLVEPSGLRDTVQIGANYWNMPRVLEQIYHFPAGWEDPPRVYRMWPDWQRYLLRKEGVIQLKDFTVFAPPQTLRNLPVDEAIFIHTGSGVPVRRSEPVELDGQPYEFKQAASSGPPAFEPGFLFPFLAGSIPP